MKTKKPKRDYEKIVNYVGAQKCSECGEPIGIPKVCWWATDTKGASALTHMKCRKDEGEE